MLRFVRERNLQLVDYAANLRRLLLPTSIPPELNGCKELILQSCQYVEKIAQRNLTLIDLRSENIEKIRSNPSVDFVKEILQDTNYASNLTRTISAYYAPAILRVLAQDRLSLHILGWLHRAHKQTYDIPPVIINSSVAVLPLEIPIYHFPVMEQRGLLYQALSFHEFGHVLYVHHSNEMDDLVSDLRAEILDYLSPDWYKDDRFDKVQSVENQAIADTWYNWIQELFCDAVGFQIGGPAYFHAFAYFLSSFAESDFHRQPYYLRNSEHPVRWLRIRFLQYRADRDGFSNLADEIGGQWNEIAKFMQIEEDYYGYYDPALDDAIEETLAYMLEEASPRKFTEVEAAGEDWVPTTDSPVQLLNWAWRNYLEGDASYSELEQKAITQLLDQT